MKITVFTSNQPRHIALINKLAKISDSVYAIMECNTVFPGMVQDFFKKSETMKTYFSNVMAAENKVFGGLSFTDDNVKSLPIKSGDLNNITEAQLSKALDSDVYIVFGASYIKGWLANFLVEKKAYNIHMGISPYYRGSSCNFWAMYDGRPEFVGATIHLLSKGLDSGPMLYHALPKFEGETPFEFTMKSVAAAQDSLIARIASGDIFQMEAHDQDKTKELKYTRNADFSDEIAAEYLSRNETAEQLNAALISAEYPELLNPFFG